MILDGEGDTRGPVALSHNIKQGVGFLARLIGYLAVVSAYRRRLNLHPQFLTIKSLDGEAVQQFLDDQSLRLARHHPLEFGQGLWHGREWARGHVAGVLFSPGSFA